MRMPLALLLALALASCQVGREPALFDLEALHPVADAEATITGWLSVSNRGELKLYPVRSALTAWTTGGCISVRPLSAAGIVTSEYNGRQMSVHGALAAEAASGCKMTLLAREIGAP